MKNRIVLMAIALMLVHTLSSAQRSSVGMNDHLFASPGSGMLTVATGLPYVGAFEYAFGISDRFTMGFVAAAAPPASAFGLRLRGVIFQEDGFRLYVRTPLLYYPPHPDLFCGEPWVLAWPVLSAEWLLSSGARASVGGGVVGAACVHSLLGHSRFGEDFMGGIWNTVHLGFTLPLNRRLTFQSEASAVMQGFKFAGEDWIAKFPVIAVIGVSYSLFPSGE